MAESVNEYIASKEIERAIGNMQDGNLKNAQGILKQCTTKVFRKERRRLLILTKLPPPVYFLLRDLRHKIRKKFQKK
jgi:hypothetical protein